MKLRMAELLFVDVIRRYLETLADGQVGWLAGLRNPVVSRTLALLHDAPTRNWTLEALAAQVGSSRSVIAERFMHFIGQPPMHICGIFACNWRVACWPSEVARLLRSQRRSASNRSLPSVELSRIASASRPINGDAVCDQHRFR